jgi:hypothetical protein
MVLDGIGCKKFVAHLLLLLLPVVVVVVVAS